MSPGIIVLIVLALLVIGAVARRSRDKNEGPGFGGSLGLAVFALPVLLLTGRL